MPLSMNVAKAVKVDEFYTLMKDVEAELHHYSHFFNGKSIFCCCDNPQFSNFCEYFRINYKVLGIKRLICSWFQKGNTTAKWAEYDVTREQFIIHIMDGDGSFDSEGCKSLMNEADIIVTNPPFSKSRLFIEFLITHNKKFVIVCNRNTIITKKIFPLLMNQTIKFGYGFQGNTGNFMIPKSLYGHYSNDVVRKEQNIVRFRNVSWLTNLDIHISHKKLPLNKKFSRKEYKFYDQYNAINVDKISDIPYDYYGEMGVPITILDKFDYTQYELLGLDRFMPSNSKGRRFTIEGKEKYARVLIRKKVQNE